MPFLTLFWLGGFSSTKIDYTTKLIPLILTSILEDLAFLLLAHLFKVLTVAEIVWGSSGMAVDSVPPWNFRAVQGTLSCDFNGKVLASRLPGSDVRHLPPPPLPRFVHVVFVRKVISSPYRYVSPFLT